MSFVLVIEKKAKKQLQKIDKIHAKKITDWMAKNLNNCSNPYIFGKPLKGNLSNLWRYRVGDYRILAHIYDNKLVITVVQIGHRKEIYD